MFPHSDTVYTVHNLRLQDELQYAARQRLAATAQDATGTQPLLAAINGGYQRIRAAMHNAVAMLGLHTRSSGAGRTEAAGIGIR